MQKSDKCLTDQMSELIYLKALPDFSVTDGRTTHRSPRKETERSGKF